MNALVVPKSLEHEHELRKTHIWRSYHIFYGGNPLTLLRDCVFPLANELKQSRKIKDFFFINYWLEGAHIRFRLRLSPKEKDTVDEIVLQRVQHYLEQYPSYHPALEYTDKDYYEKLFVGEFSEKDRPKYFKSDGTPKLVENNTIEIREYEPEWLRYGGQLGMLISERHFVESTKFVETLATQGNLGVRTILLGIATQIMFVTASCLLRSEERVYQFFVDYDRYWKNYLAWPKDSEPVYRTERGHRQHQASVDQIEKWILPYLSHIINNELIKIPEFLRTWANNCNKTYEQIKEACSVYPLRFSYPDGIRDIDDADYAAWTLCHSFIHMMNNRLLVSVSDEAFISYQIIKAMR